jgi:hypothetical protein
MISLAAGAHAASGQTVGQTQRIEQSSEGSQIAVCVDRPCHQIQRLDQVSDATNNAQQHNAASQTSICDRPPQDVPCRHEHTIVQRNGSTVVDQELGSDNGDKDLGSDDADREAGSDDGNLRNGGDDDVDEAEISGAAQAN